ncbi:MULTISPECIES: FAD-binding oxidoreductase [unclassified Streptomyces]|uniref:FAD-binding oxidoreductase n=1 Tax=unclassified Streptomyces TaxID=2593676 RepID=UPI002250C847|nr:MULTISPECIES: FAD-binding oxidoreductase [unclassified Streptomyces]MCX4404757.1 FAD-binding oxidoreductase [Streptomyces sp. NBC_01764]MCX5190696.1 FAD-binding oxidoreductase [Streptomyces sp. NBC_00268]
MSVSTEPHTHPDFPTDFRGAVLRPGDDQYDAARAVYQGRAADEGPALIARCADEKDVATVLRYASAHAIPVAVRSGGHGSDGYAMPGGALVIDVSAMRAVTVDPETRVLRAQPGVKLGEMDAAAQQHGLAVPAGTVSSTGVAGLTLGGGIGYLMRRYGATVDNLLACDMITVDGRKVRADETENPELFWALRGGGGNFGVVTSLEYRAHPVGPDVVAGQLIFPFDQAADVLGKLSAHLATAPRELGLLIAIAPAPPLPMLPEHVHGKPVLVLVVVYTGDAATAHEVVEPLSALGQPLAHLVAKTTWVQANSMLDAVAPYGMRMNLRGGYLPTLSADAVDVLLDNVAAVPSNPGLIYSINISFMGGAISEDVDEDAMAFSREGAAWLWEAICKWDAPEDDAQYDEWATTLTEAMRPHALTNGYANLTDDLGEEWRRGVHGSEAKHERLRSIKAAWDPHNLLRFNKNIAPETTD